VVREGGGNRASTGVDSLVLTFSAMGVVAREGNAELDAVGS
jgi:hypothetical protein